MDIDRRSLMKGLLAGGALLALGTPSWTCAEGPTRNPKRCLLFLGDATVDDQFANGVRAACQEVESDELEIMKVYGGLLSDPGKLVSLFEQTSGARWIAVMDDASAAVFQELARTAGGRFLSVGAHASVNDQACSLRHTWLTASSAQGVGGCLASRLIAARESFSMTERFLNESSPTSKPTGWSAPGFSSYRRAGSDAMHLHCSGLSLLEGCAQLGLTGGEEWMPIPPPISASETVSRQSRQWVESVGYAVAASALGVNEGQEICSTRAFVSRTFNPNPLRPPQRFVSFVMDL